MIGLTEQLRRQGVQVALTIKTKGNLTTEMRSWLQAHKRELITELSQCPHCYVAQCDVCRGMATRVRCAADGASDAI
jgi:hypothetical protein